MKLIKVLPWAIWSLVFALVALPSLAADYLTSLHDGTQ
jgi:hypothetical protein